MTSVWCFYLAHRSIRSWSLPSGCRCLHYGRAMGCRAGSGSRSACPCTPADTGIGSRRRRWCTRRRSCRATGSHHTRWRPVCRSFRRRRACRYRCSGTQWRSTGRRWHTGLRHKGRLDGTVYLRAQTHDVLVWAIYFMTTFMTTCCDQFNQWWPQPLFTAIILLCVTWPSRWAAALVRLETLKLAGASIATRRADADVVDGSQAAAVGVAEFAGAVEVHRVPLCHGATRGAIHTWRGVARVTKLAPASCVSIPTPEKTQVERSAP